MEQLKKNYTKLKLLQRWFLKPPIIRTICSARTLSLSERGFPHRDDYDGASLCVRKLTLNLMRFRSNIEQFQKKVRRADTAHSIGLGDLSSSDEQELVT